MRGKANPAFFNQKSERSGIGVGKGRQNGNDNSLQAKLRSARAQGLF